MYAGKSALEAHGLGMRYRRGWALKDCSFRLPAGRICGLVGPNGAGKTTLLSIMAHVLEPTQGALSVLGAAPGSVDSGRTSFLAQEKPLFRRFTVAETLRLGQELNPGWDQRAAEDIVRAGNVPFDAKIGTLSGGQHTRVALAVALGKRPDLLLLDEPMSGLDPVARQELTGTLLAETAEHGTTILMSTHVLAELENVCDYLVVLSDGKVRLAGDVDELLSVHTMVTGTKDGEGLPASLAHHPLVESRISGRQFTALIRPDGPATGPWETDSPSTEELLLAYLRSPDAPPLITPTAQVQDQAYNTRTVAA
ncbi:MULTISPECIES: ABC transporter ATP-binding protein [unclassified Streptomyces]|uniref:ABC transporter ATP-binding protein n=1 Tax=unclassified Streptomyces TaxID=2593676 RepID=UPI00244292DA|nr:ABC transporter ATP-binding protein [Streptomyces sp. DH41]MDG9723774.1 ABC transporter ATP-binding protein [Streptomyces sp. DH41]